MGVFERNEPSPFLSYHTGKDAAKQLTRQSAAEFCRSGSGTKAGSEVLGLQYKVSYRAVRKNTTDTSHRPFLLSFHHHSAQLSSAASPPRFSIEDLAQDQTRAIQSTFPPHICTLYIVTIRRTISVQVLPS